jgi:hypothetical protein
MPRGGYRTGRRGARYPNRTDLHTPLAPAAPAGLAYGQHQALIDSQRQMPMAAPATAAPTPPTAAPPGPSAAPPVLPGSLGAFDRPTERPGEPVTAGLPIGPGPGPEALGPPLGRTFADIIADAATASGSNELAQLAQRARNLGQ